MSTYLVTKIETCPVCKGSRVEQHPHWVKYWHEHKICLPIEQLETWFYDNFGDSYLPDEEIPCSECDGGGTIVTQFDLRRALQEIQAEEETDQIRLFIPRKPR